MGEAFKALGWPRLNYIVSTKFFWGLDRDGNAVNRKDTLNRKYLMQAIDGSLQRLGLDFVDLVYCHRPDPKTPIEETVWAMSDIIASGKALYWGTSEWSAAEIRAAWEIAERHHLQQARDGAAAVPPLPPRARRAGVRAPLRGHRPRPDDLEPARERPAHRQVPQRHAGRQPRRAREHGFLPKGLTDTAKNAAVGKLEPIAADLGATLAQLAIAWAREEPARLDGDHRRVDAGAAAVEPRRGRSAAQAHARGHGAHRRDHRAAGGVASRAARR